jgi:hypothetical protein
LHLFFIKVVVVVVIVVAVDLFIVECSNIIASEVLPFLKLRFLGGENSKKIALIFILQTECSKNLNELIFFKMLFLV